jgi:hypothetical protein
MKKTAREVQRAEFIETLYSSIKRQTLEALAERDTYIEKARNYFEDGLTKEECVELMVVDGIERIAAKNYIEMIDSDNSHYGLLEYDFKYEDVYGKTLSSTDIGQRIYASSDSEAWGKAEILIDSDDLLDAERILSISKV